MSLILHERRPEPGTRGSWSPFELDPEFNLSWWGRRSIASNLRYTRLSAFEDDVEVARVELDHDERLNAWIGLPVLVEPVLEIQYIEIRNERRGEHFGSQVVARLKAVFPRVVLAAASGEGAEWFWGDVLDWSRFEHTDGNAGWPLYVNIEAALPRTRG